MVKQPAMGRFYGLKCFKYVEHEDVIRRGTTFSIPIPFVARWGHNGRKTGGTKNGTFLNGHEINHMHPYMPYTVGNCGRDFQLLFGIPVGPGVSTLSGRDPEPGQRESLCGGIGSSIHAALAGSPMTWRFYKLCE